MAGPQVFTHEEAQELLPSFERAFERIDEQRERLRVLKIKLNALEMIWGPELATKECPDHEESRSLLEQLQESENAIAAVVQELADEGALVKDVHGGLVDLYHVRDGILVQLCWKRGEEAFEAWHHVDAGFADRMPL